MPIPAIQSREKTAISSSGGRPVARPHGMGGVGVSLGVLVMIAFLPWARAQGLSEPDMLLVKGAFENDTSLIEAALERGANIELQFNGLSPLACAALKGNVRAIESLIKKGAKIDGRCRHGLTALMVAASSGQEQSVQRLVELGANVDLTEENHKTALGLSRGGNNPRIAELLVGARKPGAPSESAHGPLFLAAARGDLEQVRSLFVDKADVNVREESAGQTLLFPAAMGGHLNVLKYLLSKGLKVNARDNAGMTPLFYVVGARDLDQRVRIETARFLIDHGADVNARYKGMPLRFFAEQTGEQAMVDLIAEAGSKRQNKKRPRR